MNAKTPTHKGITINPSIKRRIKNICFDLKIFFYDKQLSNAVLEKSFQHIYAFISVKWSVELWFIQLFFIYMYVCEPWFFNKYRRNKWKKEIIIIFKPRGSYQLASSSHFCSLIYISNNKKLWKKNYCVYL